jgi:hypothetical protein
MRPRIKYKTVGRIDDGIDMLKNQRQRRKEHCIVLYEYEDGALGALQVARTLEFSIGDDHNESTIISLDLIVVVDINSDPKVTPHS